MYSAIHSTRLGYSYQDKLACLVFLQYFRKGILSKIYTDCPISGGAQLSADIWLVLNDGKGLIYEVKTGQSFKRDSKQFKKVVENFLSIFKNASDLQGRICISGEGLSRKMIRYKECARILHESAKLDGPARKAAKYFEEELKPKSSGFENLKTIHEFFRQVKFEEQPYDNSDTWEKIDEHILSEICEITKKCGLHECICGLRDEYLASRLFYVIQKHAGSGMNIFTELLEELRQFLYGRQILKDYAPSGTPNQIESRAKECVDKLIQDKFLPPTMADAISPIRIDDSMQGNTIGE